MTLIRVDGGTHNSTDAKNKMHKSRRKILDVMSGDYTKDTFGYRESQDDRLDRLEREEAEKLERRAMFDSFRIPTFCPRCEKFMRNKFDTKFYFRTGHCFSCQQDFEHKLRIAGIYPLWERIKIFENEISILREHKEKFTEVLESDKSVSEIVTSTGEIIGFEFTGSWEAIKNDIKSELAFIEETLPVAEIELERMKNEIKEKDVENILEQFKNNR